jgi:uncharacterized protein (TIGR02246 family)
MALQPAVAPAQTPAADTRPVAADADGLTQIRDQYRAAATARHAETLATLFADDGVLVPTDGAFVRGRVEIVKYFARALEGAAPDVTLTCISAESRDGFGSETGRFEERLTSPTGEVTRVSGVYVTIYRRDEAGRWRVAIEIRSRGAQAPLGNW